ncbi:MAG TPA: hypothetical protein VJN39_05455 [Gemmatimonadales bacterium]|nr:hypothetical protein [Gemmatimonadales bacterium]
MNAPLPPASLPEHELALQKLGLEVEKLRGEVRQLRFPNLGWLAALATVLISSVGLGLQCSRSDLDYRESNIKKLLTEYDVANNQVVKARLDTLIQRDKSELADLATQLQKQASRVAQAIAEADRRIAATHAADSTSHTSARAALATARHEIDSLGVTIRQRAEQSRDTLNIIQAEITPPSGLSPGSPIVVTLTLPYPATVKYRRWITRDLVNILGSFGAGETRIRLPYGGYMYFDATSSDSTHESTQAADCRHDCTVVFE